MSQALTLELLNVDVCNQDDWTEVISLLEETKLNIWLTGKEKYQEFYTVKDPDTKKVICCFTFTQKGPTGILKNFAVSKSCQGKGIGTYIANNLVPKVAKERGISNLYLMGNDRPPFTSIHFWRKTNFKHIKTNDIKDNYFKEYVDYLIKNYSDAVFYKESAFYMNIN